jgi:hypothetical protein
MAKPEANTTPATQKIAAPRQAEFTLLQKPTADDLITLFEHITGRKPTDAERQEITKANPNVSER